MKKTTVSSKSKQRIIRDYEPKPMTSHKSFYGKCRIYDTDDGYSYLKSYDTIVAYRDSNGNYHRTWHGYSATTMRHLVAFGLGWKKEWDNLETEKLPSNHPF